VWGAVVGATLITLLKQLLQNWLPQLLGREGNFEMVVFGILMILLLQRTRDGLWPWLARLLPGQTARAVPSAPALPVRVRPDGAAPLLMVERVRKEFGGLIAVDDLSFEIRSGEILGLIGPNGAGKSTMFNLISGTLPLSRGNITFNGQQIAGRQPFQIAQLGIGRTFQHVKLIAAMSVLDNVALGAYLRGLRGKKARISEAQGAGGAESAEVAASE
jgi:branched-chain amino acid transport system permease protein